MKRLLTLSAIPLAVLALAACGGSSPKKHTATTVAGPAPAANKTTTTAQAPVAASATVDVAADPTGQLKFTQSKLSTKAGKVTIDFTNKAPLPHDMVLIDSASYSPSAKVLGQTPVFQGATKSFTATLTPGTYYYYCSVPGHRQAGMQGTLTVTGAAGGSSSSTTSASKPSSASKPAPTKAASKPATGSSTLDVAADPTGQLKFTQSKVSTKAGKVTIDFTNKAPLPHDMVLIDSASYSPSAKVLGQTPVFQGATKSFTATLAPGTYYYYCSVPGHRQAGMQGTLTVTGAAGGSSSSTTSASKPSSASKPAPTKAASKPATGSSTLDVAADPTGQLKFTQSKVSTKAGKVTIDFTNKAPLPHDMVLIDSASYSPSAKVLGQTPVFQGATKSFTATLTPGTYYYYCSVPGHRQAGMQGTLLSASDIAGPRKRRPLTLST